MSGSNIGIQTIPDHQRFFPCVSEFIPDNVNHCRLRLSNENRPLSSCLFNSVTHGAAVRHKSGCFSKRYRTAFIRIGGNISRALTGQNLTGVPELLHRKLHVKANQHHINSVPYLFDHADTGIKQLRNHGFCPLTINQCARKMLLQIQNRRLCGGKEVLRLCRKPHLMYLIHIVLHGLR